MSETKTLIDPKELVPAGIGFVLGLAILVMFYFLAVGIDMPLIAETWALPRQ